MDAQKKICIMVSQLYKNHETIKISELDKRYHQFFNSNIDKQELQVYITNLEKEGMLSVVDSIVIPTNEGIKIGNNLHIEYYFSEGVKSGLSSNAEIEYQKRKGIGLPNDSMIDQEQIDYILNQVKISNGTIVDIGCGKGGITSFIQSKTNRKMIGLDKSEEMLNIAKNNNNKIEWKISDFNNLNLEYFDIGVIILIDSIYFCTNYKELLKNINDHLNDSGIMIITYSEYSKYEINEITSLEKLLIENSYSYNMKDFTQNEIRIWESRISVAYEIKDKFISENNEYLFYDKIIEAKGLLSCLKDNRAKRVIFTISKNITIAST